PSSHPQVPSRESVPLAGAPSRVRFPAPELARAIRPGQFVSSRRPGGTAPLLGRPFALYDTVLDAQGQPTALDVVYLVIGKLTSRLAALRPGDRLEVWGPLGNGFPDLAGRGSIALVGGGIGQTPFLAYVRALLGQRGYGGQPARGAGRQGGADYGGPRAGAGGGGGKFRRAGGG